MRLKMLAFGAAAAFAGCIPGQQTGRIVGYVVNRQTSQPINLFKASGEKQNITDDADSKNQVYAVVNGQFRRARPCGAGDLNHKNGVFADGCFQIDGIPYGDSASVQIPIFANVEGFEPFHGVVENLFEAMVDADVVSPQFVRNIGLYPKGMAGVAYSIHVTYNNQPVQGASVACHFSHAVDDKMRAGGSHFIAPANTLTPVVKVNTDASGVATLPGSQLVLGGTYNCDALLSQSFDGRILSGTMELQPGLDQPNQKLALMASDSFGDTYIVSSSADNRNTTHGPDGKLVMTFNRSMELIPNSADCVSASVSGVDFDGDGIAGGLLPTPVPNNNESEQVEVVLSADGRTLSLGLRGAVLDEQDINVFADFTGIFLRPKDIQDAGLVFTFGGPGSCTNNKFGPSATPLTNLQTGAQYTSIRLY